MTFVLRPIQRPRIPMWVVAVAAGDHSMARALRWDGRVIQTGDVSVIVDIAARARAVRYRR